MKYEEKPYAWIYTVNNTYTWVSFVEPPDDAFDEGTLVPVYTKPQKKEMKKIECTQIDAVTEDGWSEWQFPIHKGYLMQCCDCGLVHEVDFKVVEKVGRTKKDGSWEAEKTKKGQFRVGMKMRRYE